MPHGRTSPALMTRGPVPLRSILASMGSAALAAGLVWLVLIVAGVFLLPNSGGTARAVLLACGLLGLNCISYLVWFDRWNILAHTQLAFSFIAYIVPIFFLHNLNLLDPSVVSLYEKIVVVGFGCAAVGVFFGAALAGKTITKRIARIDALQTSTIIARRTIWVGSLSVLAVIGCFAVMGFVPALASDPLLAKFFRGPYAAGYARVAPLYRTATAAISLLLPVIVVFAAKRRTPVWLFALLGGPFVLLLGLTRQPAVNGVLLALGVYFAASRARPLLLYIAILVGAYLVGAALYSLLSTISPSLSGFASATSGHPQTFLQRAASGAPDVTDQGHFLTAWLSQPIKTYGRTFYGGLIPGHYRWNPAVFSLQVLSPGGDVNSIQSGGIRLPAPLWGFVSLGWPGVVGVSFGYGAVTGFLAAHFKRLVPSASVERSVCWLTLYVAASAVFPVFFRLGYLPVIQLVIVWIFLFSGKRASAAARSPDEADVSIPQALAGVP